MKAAGSTVETQEAWLMNHERRVTLHRFKRSRPVRRPDQPDGLIIGIEHMFQCSETGAIRRWGFEGAGEAN